MKIHADRPLFVEAGYAPMSMDGEMPRSRMQVVQVKLRDNSLELESTRSELLLLPANFPVEVFLTRLMPQRSPTLEGFRVLFRRPSLTLAEVAWRWSFWAAGGFLFSALVIEYLDTLPVGPRDLLFLNSGQPTLMGRALSHIFQGSGLRLLLGTIVVFATLAIAWTLVAAVGRSVSLGAIRDYFAQIFEPARESRHVPGEWRLRSLAGLNLLRLTAGLAASVGVVGAVVLPTAISSQRSPKSALTFLLTLAILLLVSIAWTAVNWILSLSAVFATRDQSDSFSALAAATRFSRERASGLWAINFWFGLTHLALFFVATTVASMLLGMAQFLPGVLVLSALLLVTLLYFVAADSIHIGRMAAWYCLAEMPVTPRPAPGTVPPRLNFQAAEESHALASAGVPMQFPPEDDILSDVEAREPIPPAIEPTSET